MHFRFGHVSVDIKDGYTITRLPYGGEVIASHEENDGQRDIAEAHGYSTAEEMNRDHDLVHSLLCHWLGLPESPTLKGIATKNYCPQWGFEESAVLAIQRFAKNAGVNIIQVSQRHSDENKNAG